MKKKTGAAFAPVGGATLLTIFTVLCLTVFALLCLSTALSGRRLSCASCEAIEAYQAADCAAEEILARLRTGEKPDNVTEENGIFTYSCPISETRTLEVAVRLSGEDYEILRWQSVPVGDWQADEDLELWDGTIPQ